MLPPYIIEELRRREQARREESKQPQIELDIPRVPPREPTKREDGERGVTIIDVF